MFAIFQGPGLVPSTGSGADLFSPLFRGSNNIHSAQLSPCPHNINTKKETAANPALLRTASEIVSCGHSFLSFLFFSILINVFHKLQNSSTELTHLKIASVRFTKNPVFKVTNKKSWLLLNIFTNDMNLEPVQTCFIRTSPRLKQDVCSGERNLCKWRKTLTEVWILRSKLSRKPVSSRI